MGFGGRAELKKCGRSSGPPEHVDIGSYIALLVVGPEMAGDHLHVVAGWSWRAIDLSRHCEVRRRTYREGWVYLGLSELRD